jgi:hypoxanthine-DNA glycosylase
MAERRAPATPPGTPPGTAPADVLTLPLLHALPPVVAPHTRLLVLGSFPGAASLAAGQYYAHPRNQFWPLLGALWGLDLHAMPYAQRLDHLLERGLGLWDVYARCRRRGSLDADIRDAELNDFSTLSRRAPALRGVAHNGGTSARAGRPLQALGLATWRLPSSSPAHAGWSFERKLAAWREVFEAAGVQTRPAARAWGVAQAGGA